MNDVWNDFDEADPSQAGGQSNGIKVQGNHQVKILNVKLKPSEQYNAIYLIVEFELLRTDCDDLKVGKEHGWAHDITQKFFGATGAKNFLAAALGFDSKSDEAMALTKKDMEESWGEDQPLAGETVNLKTQPKITKGGYDFVVHDWSPVEGG